MSNKVQERRERKIKEAIKAKNWDENKVTQNVVTDTTIDESKTKQ